MFDVIIVGAGPAGMSAALVLGRCRRRVLLCDGGQPRNTVSRAVHGYLSSNEVSPLEFRRIGLAQLAPYDVTIRGAEVTDARRCDEGFEVSVAGHGTERGALLLLATGTVDRLPQVEGFADLYGRSAFTCPYCDGWEVRDRPLVAYALGPGSAEFALGLKTWSADVLLCTDGEEAPAGEEAACLERHGIPVRSDRIARLEGDNGRLGRVVFERGDAVERAALFFHLGMDQRSNLAVRLGGRVTPQRGIVTGWCEETDVPGLFVAGDASVEVELAIVAAAEGAKAAYAINRRLRERALGCTQNGR